jgi:hypothetical protein
MHYQRIASGRRPRPHEVGLPGRGGEREGVMDPAKVARSHVSRSTTFTYLHALLPFFAFLDEAAGLGHPEWRWDAAPGAVRTALDPTGRGISTSAILGNPETRTYYEQHRRWNGTRPARRTPRPEPPAAARPRVNAQRDIARARQRYRRWTKGLLIERLLAVERAFAEQEGRWLRVNDELRTWQLRATSAPPECAIVRADPTEVGGPHHGYESPVTHRGD